MAGETIEIAIDPRAVAEEVMRRLMFQRVAFGWDWALALDEATIHTQVIEEIGVDLTGWQFDTVLVVNLDVTLDYEAVAKAQPELVWRTPAVHGAARSVPGGPDGPTGLPGRSGHVNPSSQGGASPLSRRAR